MSGCSCCEAAEQRRQLETKHSPLTNWSKPQELQVVSATSPELRTHRGTACKVKLLHRGLSKEVTSSEIFVAVENVGKEGRERR